MRRVIFVLAVIFSFILSGFAQVSNQQFTEVYQKALELNSGRFTNLDQIQVGDTILFPAHSGSGVELWVADAPKGNLHDCIWRLTERYLAYDLVTTPFAEPDPEIWNIGAGIQTPEKEESNFPWLALMLALMLIASVIYFIRRENSINRNPVLPGGLSDDASRALTQINAITPGLQIVKVERGQIFGATPGRVDMLFSDKSRKVDLISGDDTYRVTEFDGSISYYRQHCGNLINPIADGKFPLPAGWVFVPYTNEQATWSAPEVTTEEAAQKAEVEAESPLEVTVSLVDELPLSGTDIAMILEAAGKMVNVPSSIMVGDLSIVFKQEKSE